jgi:hypothetical protein
MMPTNDLALAVAERRPVHPVTVANFGETLVAARRSQAGADHREAARPIVFLDTLGRDIREALALIEQAALCPPKPPGWYFRLADVGEALALIDQAGLLPRMKPGWYFRLREFAGVKA